MSCCIFMRSFALCQAVVSLPTHLPPPDSQSEQPGPGGRQVPGWAGQGQSSGLLTPLRPFGFIDLICIQHTLLWVILETGHFKIVFSFTFPPSEVGLLPQS